MLSGICPAPYYKDTTALIDHCPAESPDPDRQHSSPHYSSLTSGLQYSEAGLHDSVLLFFSPPRKESFSVAPSDPLADANQRETDRETSIEATLLYQILILPRCTAQWLEIKFQATVLSCSLNFTRVTNKLGIATVQLLFIHDEDVQDVLDHL